jgi:hypothetical protein
MRTVNVAVELDDDKFRAYEDEARRQGTTVESLVKRTIRILLLEQEERLREEEEDHPIHIT